MYTSICETVLCALVVPASPCPLEPLLRSEAYIIWSTRYGPGATARTRTTPFFGSTRSRETRVRDKSYRSNIRDVNCRVRAELRDGAH